MQSNQATRMFAALAAWLCGIGWQSVFASTIVLNPGVYEITAETLLPHLEENLRYATTRSKQCLSKQNAAAFFPIHVQSSFEDCSLIDAQTDQEQSNYVLNCRNPEAATGSAQFTIKPAYFYGLLEVKMGGKNMKFSQRVRGNRLGACEAGK